MGMITDGLWCAFNNYHMGVTAENVAKEYSVDRPAQDAFALASQQKAAAAQKAGKFKDQIVPIAMSNGKTKKNFEADEYIKATASADSLSKLKPAFQKNNGSITAGNASGLNDGAALCLLMPVAKAKQMGLEVLATIRAFAAAGV